jgi:hypothetical protein
MSTQLPTHKHYAVMKDWAEGKIIEFKGPYDKEWCVVKQFQSLAWIPEFEYRTKQEPLRYRVALFLYGDNDYYTANANTDIVAENFPQERSFVKWLTDWIEYQP